MNRNTWIIISLLLIAIVIGGSAAIWIAYYQPHDFTVSIQAASTQCYRLTIDSQTRSIVNENRCGGNSWNENLHEIEFAVDQGINATTPVTIVVTKDNNQCFTKSGVATGTDMIWGSC
ncbi:MAG TPA: hypothetical protein VE177_06575 [Candidatus Binatus sp.]|nr:hypothetical protein [Candidatus Binatus sp.]